MINSARVVTVFVPCSVVVLGLACGETVAKPERHAGQLNPASASASSSPISGASTTPVVVSASATSSAALAPCFPFGESHEFRLVSDKLLDVCVVNFSAEKGTCCNVDLNTGKYSPNNSTWWAAPQVSVDSPKFTSFVNAAGSFVAKTTINTIEVCAVSDEKKCHTITIAGYKPHKDAKTYLYASHLVAEVSPDGKQVLTVLFEKGSGHKGVTFALYDVLSGKRTKSTTVQADEFVRTMAWAGDRVLYDVCVEAGPGCSAYIFDPQAGKVTPLEMNVYGARPRFVYVDEKTMAAVAGEGSGLSFVDMKTGKVSDLLRFPYSGTVEDGVKGVKKGQNLYLSFGAPSLGAVAVVDLLQRKVTHSFAPPKLCEKNGAP